MCCQHLDKLSKLFEPDHATNPSKWFLMPNLVRRWTESLIDKTVWFNRAKAQGVFNSFNGVSKSGPAFTFKFHGGWTAQVDVDFVPSIYVPNCENFLQNTGFTTTWDMIKVITTFSSHELSYFRLLYGHFEKNSRMI